MYVASFTRHGLVWHASVINKKWSEEIFSYEVDCTKKKNFAFLFNAKRWARKQILNNMIERRELEFVNG